MKSFNLYIMNKINLSSIQKQVLFILIILSGFVSTLRAEVKLPGIFSDHMVLQRGQKLPIWGEAAPNEIITIKFHNYSKTVSADKNGRWSVSLPKQKAGGPYTLNVNDIVISDVYVGDVFLCSGQSNMELTVKRVMSKYKDEIETYENNLIRYTKTAYAYDFVSPRTDCDNQWKICNQANVYDYSALCYFFAKELQHDKNVAIGIINSSWGGTPIAAWSTKESLERHPKFKTVFNSELFFNPNYPDSVKMNDRNLVNKWYEDIDKKDGLKNLSSERFNTVKWKQVNVFNDRWGEREGNPVTGVYYFRRHVYLPDSLAGKKAILQVGTLKDADVTYVNGVQVGNTSYQYPPRIYNVPSGVLKGGDNEIIIRLLSCNGRPMFVNGKPYQLEIDSNIFEFDAKWECHLSCVMPPQPSVTNFQNHPTGLYNAMIHPLRDYAIKGVIWYQGESDCGMNNSMDYEAHLMSLIQDWRKQWHNSELPFVIVQLANFQEWKPTPMESGIANVREAQRMVSLNNKCVGLATAIDLGESNDIHPLNKKDLAHRCVLQFDKIAYGNGNFVADGPLPSKATFTKETGILIKFQKDGGVIADSNELEGFTVASDDKIYHNAKAYLRNNMIVIPWQSPKRPKYVRYAWQNNPKSTLYNTLGLPSSSFQLEIK